MRCYLLFIFVFTFALKVCAQEMPIPEAYGRSIGLGLSGNYNLSKPGNAYYIGVGIYGILELPLKTSKLNGTVSAGFTNFFENRVTKNLFINPKGLSFPNYNYINLDLGLKYYIALPFYIAAGSGFLYGLQYPNKEAVTCSTGAGVATAFKKNAIELSSNYTVILGGYSEPLSNIGHVISFKLTYKYALNK